MASKKGRTAGTGSGTARAPRSRCAPTRAAASGEPSTQGSRPHGRPPPRPRCAGNLPRSVAEPARLGCREHVCGKPAAAGRGICTPATAANGVPPVPARGAGGWLSVSQPAAPGSHRKTSTSRPPPGAGSAARPATPPRAGRGSGRRVRDDTCAGAAACGGDGGAGAGLDRGRGAGARGCHGGGRHREQRPPEHHACRSRRCARGRAREHRGAAHRRRRSRRHGDRALTHGLRRRRHGRARPRRRPRRCPGRRAAGRPPGRPILLTPRAALPAAVSEEIDRLGATAVVLLGGEAAIGPPVALDLALQGYDVDRVAGEDRFWTAAAIAERLGPTTRVAVANAFSPPDALAAAAWAAGSGRVILLTTRDAVPEATAEALTALDPHEVAVIGGTAVIDEATAATLGQGRSLRRLSGGPRYDTAAVVRA